MAQPTTYNRVTSFSNFQAVNPTSPLPASSVDQEFNAVKTTLDGVLNNLELIQRDDGALANDSVGLDQLSAEVTVGFNVPQVWVTSTAYTANVSTVFHGSGFYRAITTHTSGVFATDLAALKWALIVDLSAIPLVAASAIAVTPTGAISSTDVQAAIAELDSEKAAVSHTHVATAISDSTATGRTLMTAASVAAVLAALGLTYGAPDYGSMRPTARITAATGWLFCYGQAISRTTYAGLFAAITIQQTCTRTASSAIVTGLTSTTNMRAGMPVSGTGVPVSTTILTVDSATQVTMSNVASSSGSMTLCVAPYGVGDGSTTFNVPNYEGRVGVGRDDMSGSAAGRITTAAVSIDGTRQGAAGGAQTMTLAQANLPNATLAVAIASGQGSHLHTGTAPIANTLTSGGGSGAYGVGATAITIAAATLPAMTGVAASMNGGVTQTATANVQPSIVENVEIFAGV